MPDLPDPSTLSDEELDTLLETGQFPEPKEDDKKDDVADDEDKPDNKDKPEDKEDKSDDTKDDDKDDEGKPEDKKPDKGDEDEEEPEDGKPVVDDEKPEDKKPSRRETARVRDLLEKYGDPEKPAEKPKASGIDYEKDLEADPTVVKKLEEDRQAASDDAYNRGLEQMNSVTFLTRLEIDAPRVEAKYPQLDKDSDDFKPDAASDVNLLFLRLAGFDPKTKAVRHPDLRYTDFVETIFGLANDLADTKIEKQVKEVKKQVSQTGLRPDGSKAKTLNLNKAPEDMTDEELDEYLKQAGVPTR